MRRFRSISDYLSLGTLANLDARAQLYGRYQTADVRQAPRPFEQRDLVVAERLTVKHLREGVAQLAADRVPPVPNTGERILHGYIDKSDGGLVIVKAGTSPEEVSDLGELVWIEPDPAAEGFGPFYRVSLPPQDMTAICGEPEFQDGLAAGEFRVAGEGSIIVRPPAGET